jgi:hypothetical protein
MAKVARSRRAVRKATPAKPRITSPIRPKTPANTYTSKPVSIDFAGPNHRFSSADLEILGIDHSQSSYEGRIFFNNPKANANTPKTLDHGYAGSFYIFGHGGCYGDVGHCEIHQPLDSYDFRDPNPLLPTLARVTVTDALKYFAKANSEVTITIVPVVGAANELCDTKNVFHFQEMRFLSYNS